MRFLLKLLMTGPQFRSTSFRPARYARHRPNAAFWRGHIWA
jgi:hypothetical protein